MQANVAGVLHAEGEGAIRFGEDRRTDIARERETAVDSRRFRVELPALDRADGEPLAPDQHAGAADPDIADGPAQADPVLVIDDELVPRGADLLAYVVPGQNPGGRVGHLTPFVWRGECSGCFLPRV